jgi:hypothetical protein
MFTGTHEEKLAQVIDVRNAIRARLEAWIETFLSNSSDAPFRG